MMILPDIEIICHLYPSKEVEWHLELEVNLWTKYHTILKTIIENIKKSEGISDENDEGLKCHYCSDGGIMSQIHYIKCPAWGHLREGLNLTRIEDMVTFFTKLMEELDKKWEIRVWASYASGWTAGR